MWWINEKASRANGEVTSIVVFIYLRNDESSERPRHPSQKKPRVITAAHVWFVLPKKGLSWRAQRASITYLRVPMRWRPVGKPQRNHRSPTDSSSANSDCKLQAPASDGKTHCWKKRGINYFRGWWFMAQRHGHQRCGWVSKTGLQKLEDMCVK